MYAHSLVYPTDSEIIVLGGFDINKKASNNCFKMKILGDDEEIH